MFMRNIEGTEFRVGDYVAIADTLLPTSVPYTGRVVRVLHDDETGGLGKHYVVYIATMIEDRLEIREAPQVYLSESQYYEIAQKIYAKNQLALEGIRRNQQYYLERCHRVIERVKNLELDT